MGTYLNPGNSGFVRILKSEYVDKTGLISLLNQTIDTTKNLTCVSRPRRFGKSYAAQMLCAYYDKSCDSAPLFDGYAISEDKSYRTHLNKYNVIYLDMTQVMGEAGREGIVQFIKDKLTAEILDSFPSLRPDSTLSTTLIRAAELSGSKFVAIIDEWDAPVREMPSIEWEYLHFLRTLFKGSGTTSRIFAAAYMTGILPIKKDGSQSAISDFREYTMLKPRKFGGYIGFTEDEVRILCETNRISFSAMKQWYDGYEFKDTGPVYNPNSVMQAIDNDDFDSYWTETSAAEKLMEYISKPLNKTV